MTAIFSSSDNPGHSNFITLAMSPMIGEVLKIPTSGKGK